MYWVFNILLVTIPVQWYLGSGVSLHVLGSLFFTISRLLFIGRMIGTSLKFKHAVILEGFSVGIVFIASLLSKKPMNWGSLAWYVGLTAIAIVMYFIDNNLYLYVEEDEDYESDANSN